ncbi:MAG: S-adenosylmethionine:tRNA ribosyltransferase-isomerase [Bacteroidetes bacterium]|nr:S-adenosylmethionine:tRNA ribosyltransferase-isomerase [Bacteroidota bacterium]
MQHPADLKISDFTYELPDARIAAYPLADRSSSRLLVAAAEGATVKGTGAGGAGDGGAGADRIHDRFFSELPKILVPGSILLYNNTKVIPARLYMHRPTGARVELLCLNPAQQPLGWDEALSRTGSSRWICMAGNARRWRDEALMLETSDLRLTARKVPSDGQALTVQFEWEPAELSFSDVLMRAGQMPIPPYLKREAEAIDQQRYQTHYAQNAGSVAAPTAGLHFTPELWSQLDAAGIGRMELTLHVGAGTFKPVTADTMRGHDMHSEVLRVDKQLLLGLVEHLQKPNREQLPLICVGTTSLRSLESLYWIGALLQENDTSLPSPKAFTPYDSEIQWGSSLPDPEEALMRIIHWLEARNLEVDQAHTALMIAPGYRFRLADQLITNFHQPGSTLLLLVAAVVGERWRALYQHALQHEYRFLSYGDSSLLRIHPDHKWKRTESHEKNRIT